jgi:hypothetical protein
MGREIRRVPAGWEHPQSKQPYGWDYNPMYNESYREHLEDWWKNYQMFELGTYPQDDLYTEKRKKMYRTRFEPGAHDLVPAKVIAYKRALEAWFEGFLTSDREGEFWNRIGTPPQPEEFGLDDNSAEADGFEYWNWSAAPDSNPQYYRPYWKPEEMTHYQIYQTVSEGTPTSPVFTTLAEMEMWLVSEGYSPAAAKGFIQDEYCFSAMFTVNPAGERTSPIMMNIASCDKTGLAQEEEPEEFTIHADYDWDDAAHNMEDRWKAIDEGNPGEV